MWLEAPRAGLKAGSVTLGLVFYTRPPHSLGHTRRPGLGLSLLPRPDLEMVRMRWQGWAGGAGQQGGYPLLLESPRVILFCTWWSLFRTRSFTWGRWSKHASAGLRGPSTVSGALGTRETGQGLQGPRVCRFPCSLPLLFHRLVRCAHTRVPWHGRAWGTQCAPPPGACEAHSPDCAQGPR